MPSILRSKSDVEAAIAVSTSIRECLEFLGLRAAGGNYKAFHAACDAFGLQPPTFDHAAWLRSLPVKSIPLDDILVEKSTYSNRTVLKRRLAQEGLLRNICYECGLLPYWNNKPLSLQLEHKNGVYNDNRLDNLALLCPNCHTQTSTFAGRATKKPRQPKTISPRTYHVRSSVPVLQEALDIFNSIATERGGPNWVEVGKRLDLSDNGARKRLRPIARSIFFL